MKAIIFDCFGVLVTDGWQQFQVKYLSNDAEAMRESTDLQKQFDAGFISYGQFIDNASALAGIESSVLNSMIRYKHADAALLEYIATLKKSFKIGMLSNAGSNFLNEYFTKDEIAMFDCVMLSYQIGVMKPDQRAYQAVAAKLDVLPKDCIFIDDLAANCADAEAAGMKSILYVDQCELQNQILM